LPQVVNAEGDLARGVYGVGLVWLFWELSWDLLACLGLASFLFLFYGVGFAFVFFFCLIA
jgi:hypothetical protein